MKQSTKKLLLGILAFGGLGLAACGGGTTPAASSQASSENSSEATSSSAESTLPEWVDYASTDAARLTLDYKGRTFADDGIEQVTLRTCIDGDTAHFDLPSGKPVGGISYLKSRFYGIDTPESTGKVQPYGRGASKYTKRVLEEAAENGTIVVGSPSLEYCAPTPDSTGSRFVSLIWVNTSVKNAPYNQLSLLNLMIVQDGWSWVKNVLDMPTYEDVFYAAEAQAKAYGLNLFSGKPDPDHNYGEYEDTSLLELKQEVQACMADPTHVNKFDNANVRVCGTVAGYSNSILYIQDYCFYTDEEGNPIADEKGEGTGEYAGINIFTGMSAIPAKYTAIGTYISVCGNASDSENFGFQISGAKFPVLSFSDSDAQVLITAENNVEEHALHTFDYTVAELNAVARTTDYDYECFNCSVNIDGELEVDIDHSYDDADGGAFSLAFKNCAFSAYITFGVRPDPNDTSTLWKKAQYFEGHKIRLKGVFNVRKTKSGKYAFQVNPSSNDDISVVDYVA